MLFQVISLTLALAPLSMAAALSADYKHRAVTFEDVDVAPLSTDGMTDPNGAPVKRTACSVGHEELHGKKPEHHEDVASSSTDVNPVPPMKGEPGAGHPVPSKGQHDEANRDYPVKSEPGVGHPVPPKDQHVEAGQDYPVKSEPGAGHPKKPFDGSVKVGLGTSYGNDCGEEKCWQKGACSFVDYNLPAGIDGSTCVSEEIWNGAALCGSCVSVTYKGKTVKLMVTNKTDGNTTHLDMTPYTMTKLVGYPAGGIPGIEWKQIPCPFAENIPLGIKLHEGASKYWFAATVLNNSVPTTAVDVSTDGGKTWIPTERNSVNIFRLEKHPLPTDYVWVRVTSMTGEQTLVKDVKIESGATFLAEPNN